jgi:outer membrane protein OmpA-like peptidoglycan-associated protein
MAGTTASAQDKDAKGCADSPLISRIPGSFIAACTHKDDDVFDFRLSDGTYKHAEGDLTRIEYHFPASVSFGQVLRNLSTALHTAGYKFEEDPIKTQNDFVVDQGKTWIKFDFFGNKDGMREIILKETALTQDVVATAAALSGGLTGNGHVVVPGILFDTGKADVKPESSAALKEIVKLLQQNAKLKIFVVGHTDNVGPVAANLDLSKRRAAAVVVLLTTQYHVAADRLQAFGAGPYAPVAANTSEDGRSLNRRVELVAQ